MINIDKKFWNFLRKKIKEKIDKNNNLFFLEEDNEDFIKEVDFDFNIDILYKEKIKENKKRQKIKNDIFISDRKVKKKKGLWKIAVELTKKHNYDLIEARKEFKKVTGKSINSFYKARSYAKQKGIEI